MEEVKTSHTLGGGGKGIPKEREVNCRREVCEWEGKCVCVKYRSVIDCVEILY